MGPFSHWTTHPEQQEPEAASATFTPRPPDCQDKLLTVLGADRAGSGAVWREEVLLHDDFICLTWVCFMCMGPNCVGLYSGMGASRPSKVCLKIVQMGSDDL